MLSQCEINILSGFLFPMKSHFHISQIFPLVEISFVMQYNHPEVDRICNVETYVHITGILKCPHSIYSRMTT